MEMQHRLALSEENMMDTDNNGTDHELKQIATGWFTDAVSA